ncbi:methyltransferase [Shewanella sp. UCD-KL12]|uniref:methyltransferase n=1 Tax=Shewanella sp. UCD-KL12 TaxID=1917163 RepID=UPI002740442F|nr:methyltransferase [Shewanella sp. UCD-KL12]
MPQSSPSDKATQLNQLSFNQLGYNQLSHLAQFERLDSLLMKSRALWQVKAFECTELPWADTFPSLADKVWSIDDADIDALDQQQERLNAELLPALLNDLTNLDDSAANEFICQLALLQQVESQVSTPAVNKAGDELLPSQQASHFSAGIKGRKWQQITSFAAQIKPTNTEVLEWCAGKGHLGRLIAKAHARPVVSLEWQQSLCDAGTEFAQQWRLPQTFICADAFEPHQSKLQAKQQAVALHACGDLHVRLLYLASKANTESIAISPCCYHLIQAKQYQAMSAAAKSSGLVLSRHDLQMPLQQSAIANPKQKAYRHREIAWRLGFDSLQREINQSQQYLPIPSVKQSQLNQDFETFCRWAGVQKSVPIPAVLDFAHYQELGIARQRLTRRIDLVAHLFRRILEHWLLLDRICFLEAQGYHVNLSRFCSETVTPRNFLILAEKSTN